MQGDRQDTADFLGAMAGVAARRCEERAHALGEGGLSQQQDYQLGEGEPHQEAQ